MIHAPEHETRKWVLAHLSEYEGLILIGMKGDQELIDAGTNLKIITASGVGYDHIDIDYAKQKGIVVANCPKSVQVPTAEMTFALLLATVRRLHFYDKENGSMFLNQKIWEQDFKEKHLVFMVWGELVLKLLNMLRYLG